MARNEEHTMRFLAKVLWKYRGTVKFREVMIRLLEFDCIRRNYSKGTLHNILQQFRAWYRDPECKTAKKLPKSYVYYLEELKQADSEELECTVEEPITEEQTPEEPITEDCKTSAAEFSLEEQAFALQQAKKTLDENYQQFSNKINEQLRELGEKGEAARQIYLEKHEEYSKVLEYILKQIVWQEMMK